MADIFLSYASEDRERVRPLVELLEEHGWSVWWDREIPPGQTWPQMIEGALSTAKAMVVVWSEASVKSKWVQIEAAKGEQHGGLIPVAIDLVEPPLQFSLIQAADLTAWDHSPDDREVRKVIEQLEKVVGVPLAEQAAEAKRKQEVAEAKRRLEAEEGAEAKRKHDVASSLTEMVRDLSADDAQTAQLEPLFGRDVVHDIAKGGGALTRRRWSRRTVVSASVVGLGVAAVIVFQSWPNGDSAAPAVAPRIEDFRASAIAITEGDEITLTWNTSDADRVELRPGGPVAVSGNIAVTPEQDTEYVLIAYGPSGDTQQSVRINVAAADPPTASLSTEPAESNRVEGEAYLASNAQRDGVGITNSGLQYEVLREGQAGGVRPSPASRVTIHYRGTLIDGTEIDSSYSRGQPATFNVSGVIAGFSEGLQLMTVGSHYRFVIPSDIAYGPQGTALDIGPNATLIFEIELIEVL